MARYLVSDLHLDHANIIEHCDRPFDSVTEMNRALIDNWNTTVSADDIVFFLGDLGHFADEAALRAWFDELNGRIVFIEGNHDSPSRYVDGVHTHQYYFLTQGDREFCCTHRPENAPRFWDGWVIHGHHHNTHPEAYPLVNPATNCVNVSVELLDYKPVLVDTVVELIERDERITTLRSVV
ncbi:hypothetical protein [Natronosalvus amylolyticus]|uniref:hypothetical protein n=1 Tax=Natronosalvus amylolyticus TaxID=2961994 RepID=UPI0020C941BC|nr:hypothetical protein [Natronosalvus amylolyticus]